MSDNPLTELDPRIRKQVEKAKSSASSGNAGYAIDICMGILEKNPGCVEVREVLRNAQKVRLSGKKKSFLSGLTSKPLSMIGGVSVKKNPAKAMLQAEKILRDDPSSVDAHKLLADAASAMELPHTVVFAMEGARDGAPGNVPILKRLAEAYLAVDRIEDCIRACDVILKSNPGEGETQEIIKRASVAQSMKKGDWEGQGDFRSKLKNKDEAEQLEQASRTTTSEENLEKLIEESKQKVENDPENLNNYRQLSTYYQRLGDFENAIEWIRKARTLESGKSDVSLERIEAKLYRESIDLKIKEKAEEAAANPENTSLKEELSQMRSDRQKHLLAQAADMVKRYPNDYGARFQYGELLLEKGDIDAAIQQLQISTRNPKVRIAGLHALGRAYKTKKFYDLAAEQLSTAKGEILGMSDVKKNVIYDLADCYEQMKQLDKAIEQYKEIYAADIGFKDVASKIDEFYSRQNQE